MTVVPREESRDEPANDANHHGASLGADVAGLQRLADCVIALERNRQNRQDAGVSDWRRKICHAQRIRIGEISAYLPVSSINGTNLPAKAKKRKLSHQNTRSHNSQSSEAPRRFDIADNPELNSTPPTRDKL